MLVARGSLRTAPCSHSRPPPPLVGPVIVGRSLVTASTYYPFKPHRQELRHGANAEVRAGALPVLRASSAWRAKEADRHSFVENILEAAPRQSSTPSTIYSFWSSINFCAHALYRESRTARTQRGPGAPATKLRELLPRVPGHQARGRGQRAVSGDAGPRQAHRLPLLTGEDTEVLAELAEEAKARLSEIPASPTPWTSTPGVGRTWSCTSTLDRELAHALRRAPQPACGGRGAHVPRPQGCRKFRTPDGRARDAARPSTTARQRELSDQLHISACGPRRR